MLRCSLKQVCSKPCEDASWKGDKTCDDENNHCGCGWDGGDCCGTTKDYDYLYCTKCKCLDPKNQPKLKPGQKCDLHKRGDSYLIRAIITKIVILMVATAAVPLTKEGWRNITCAQESKS